MSKVQVDTIDTRSETSTMQIGSTNTSTINLGVSGDTVNIPSGVTIANAGTATGFGGTMGPAFQASLSSTQSIAQNTRVKITFDTELFDSDSKYDNSSNYRFTPATAGKYFLYTNARYIGSDDFDNFQLSIRKNGSDILFVNRRHLHYGSQMVSGIVDANTTDYFEVFIYQDTGGALTLYGDADKTYFGGYKIIL